MNVKQAVENQNMIFDIFKSAKKNNRLSHAYLFYGDEGVGKKEMAYAVACLLYCPNGGCLECETCKTILSGNHLNVDYIGIDEKKTMISKDQISMLQDEFAKTSLVEGTRVYIVDGIDTASTAAQNSLLKFVEDPANQTPTIGIFLATELSNVVNTIISRCILQHFKAVPMEKSMEVLKKDGLEELDAALAASLTNNLEEAYQAATSPEFQDVKQMFMEYLYLRTKKDAVLFYLKYQSLASDAKKLKMFMSFVLLFLEDVNFSNDNLILKPLCDKIIAYRESVKNRTEAFKSVLSLMDKQRYNVSAKNVFHELLMTTVQG